MIWVHRIRAQAGACSLVLLSLAVLGLLFSQIGVESLWYDEAWSWSAAHDWMDSEPMLPVSVLRDNHPPTYYRLLSLWMSLSGDGEFALRFWSVICFALTIPTVYLTGRVLHSPRAGIYAGALCATSPLLFAQAQEVRSYAMLLFFCSAVFLCLAYLVRERAVEHRLGSSWPSLVRRKRLDWERLKLDAAWVGLGLSALAAAHTHYVALALPAVAGSVLLVTLMADGTSRKRMAVSAAAVGSVASVLYAVSPYGLVSFLTSQKGGYDPTLLDMLDTLWYVYGNSLGYFQFGAFLTIGIALTGLTWYARQRLWPPDGTCPFWVATGPNHGHSHHAHHQSSV